MVAKEAHQRVEEESGRLTDERLSVLMELGPTKDDFAAFRDKSSAERSALEVDFDASSDMIFNYGYGCCVYEHDIHGSKPKIPSGMPDTSTPLTPEFFMNPRCPQDLHLLCPLPSLSRLLNKLWQTKVSRVPRERLTYYWSPRLGRVRLLSVRAKKNQQMYFA